ncbi:hypothetical protein [Pseudomonas sp. Hp2]|uniref:hypothetical protein n=1 Tax=Pseudomonas sp. Hp2 TaxID=701189 RepID=UPI0011296BD7|nr:hypothetical protein [Pseudomonas sp. Hp2]
MHPRKTDLARRALDSHRTALDLRQRRTLILCDGQRSVAELTRLLGPETPALVRQLREHGYLEGGDDAPGAPSATAPTAQSGGAPARRRSLGAARIYVQDMLELQRNEAAQSLRRRLMMAHDEPSIVSALLEALAELPRMTAAGYARRVRERVAEVLPEPHLPALAALEARPGSIGT